MAQTVSRRSAADGAGRSSTGGIKWLGHEGPGFAFDNEIPRHRVFCEPFQLGSRLVTSGEFLAFIADGGYDRPELWLSDGWNAAKTQRVERPALLGENRRRVVDRTRWEASAT